MTQKMEGRCLTIPLNVMGQAAVWAASLLTMVVGTLGEIVEARAWSLFLVAVAASWSIIYALRQQRLLMIRAFELGRDMPDRSMRPVP